MRIYYVPDLDRLCIELHMSRENHHGTKMISDGVTVDLDHKGTPQRIEVDTASVRYPSHVLEKVELWDGR